MFPFTCLSQSATKTTHQCRLMSRNNAPSKGVSRPHKQKYHKAGNGGIYQLSDHLWEGKYSPRYASGKRIPRNVYEKPGKNARKALIYWLGK